MMTRCRYCDAEIALGGYNGVYFAVNPAEIGVHSHVECPTTTGEVVGHQPERLP